MMARSLKGSINRPDTEAQTNFLQIITFGLQRAAGPYRRASTRRQSLLETERGRLLMAASSLLKLVSPPQAVHRLRREGAAYLSQPFRLSRI
jgi:hypothetical protein